MKNSKNKNLWGRPSRYDENIPEMLLKHFSTPEIIMKKGNKVKKLPTIAGFCKKYKIWLSSFDNRRKKNQKLMDAYTTCKLLQKDLRQEQSLLGNYNSQFTIFMGKNVFWWKDKQEITHEHHLTFTNLNDKALEQATIENIWTLDASIEKMEKALLDTSTVSI